MIGMFGIGGGVIFVPALIFLLPYTDIHRGEIIHFSIATSLLSGSIASSVSAVRHIIYKNTDFKKASYLIYGTIFASLVTPYIIVSIEPEILQIFLASLLILISIRFFTNSGKGLKLNISSKMNISLLVSAGFIIGSVSAASGIGGGLLYVPLLYMVCGLSHEKSIGSSSVVVSATMIFSSIGYALQVPEQTEIPFTLGYIYFPAGLAMGITGAVGSLTGIRLFRKLNLNTVQKLFAVILIVAALKIIFEL